MRFLFILAACLTVFLSTLAAAHEFHELKVASINSNLLEQGIILVSVGNTTKEQEISCAAYDTIGNLIAGAIGLKRF